MPLRKKFDIILLSGQERKIYQKRLKNGAEATDAVQ